MRISVVAQGLGCSTARGIFLPRDWINILSIGRQISSAAPPGSIVTKTATFMCQGCESHSKTLFSYLFLGVLGLVALWLFWLWWAGPFSVQCEGFSLRWLSVSTGSRALRLLWLRCGSGRWGSWAEGPRYEGSSWTRIEPGVAPALQCWILNTEPCESLLNTGFLQATSRPYHCGATL